MANSITATSFVGVNIGYQGDLVAVTEPNQAVEAVAKAIADAGIAGKVVPGVVVYHTDWGCPNGGEVIGAVICPDNGEESVEKFSAVKEALKQSTLTVASEKLGEQTTGFIAKFPSAVSAVELGAQWQQVAGEIFSATDTYVSCGIFEINGEVFAQAEANPQFNSDFEGYNALARQVVEKLGGEFELRSPKINYLNS